MSIRVYALAKELKIDARLVRDLCNNLNIVPIGNSPLASITDEDAARIRKCIESGTIHFEENDGQDICQGQTGGKGPFRK